jgi:hypothetical protein
VVDKQSDEYAEACTCRNMDMHISGHIEPFIRTVVDMQSSVYEERVTCRMIHVQRRAYAEWWTCGAHSETCLRRALDMQNSREESAGYAEWCKCRGLKTQSLDMQNGELAEACTYCTSDGYAEWCICRAVHMQSYIHLQRGTVHLQSAAHATVYCI